MKYTEIKNAFLNPEAMDRSAPFWSWNGKMDPVEIKSQAKDMIQKGMGGYFMHSRVGLESEYLGKEWMDSIQACVEQAKEDGAFAWLYDEDRWPSGAGGGLVTRGIKENGAKGISIRFYNERNPESEILYTYAAEITDQSIKNIRLLNEGEKKTENEKYIHIRLDYLPPTEWFNNTPPADNINKETVKKFIETSYEPYKKRFGDEFGKTIPGMFTDEPNIASSVYEYDDDDARLPFTYEFPEFFLKKRGYEIEKILPYLFMEHDESKAAKHDYFRTLGEMFAMNFSKQLYDWCEQNNLLFTGHWLAENTMGSYILLSGGIMLNYLYQHIPGIDMLRDQTIEYMTIKACTSVANQTGRNRTLTETYGVSGWQFSFEGQKWIGDYQYIQGINLRCQHLTWYSMKGCRKRDYPPVFNYQTSWWKYNNTVEEYFARIGALTSKGKVLRDTLMIHPLATAWINADIQHDDKQLVNMQIKGNEMGYKLNDYTKSMMSAHIDFDYGDEDIMALIGSVLDNKLKIGQVEYSTVVIPPGTATLYETTVKLLLKFMEAGGKVICQNAEIEYIEGRSNILTDTLLDHGNFITTNSISETTGRLKRYVSVKLHGGSEAEEVFCMVRDMGDSIMLFMTNNNIDSGYKTTVLLEGTGCLEEWDPLTGGIENTPYKALDGAVEFACDFGPCDSKIFMLNKNGEHITVEKEQEKEYKFLKGLGSLCGFERTDENVFVLDMCRFKLGNGEWSAEDEVWRNQKYLREELEMQDIYLNTGLQRYLWSAKKHKNDGMKLQIAFDFVVENIPGFAQLVIEDADDYIVTVNGEKIISQTNGWFVDKCMGRLDIPMLKEGKNTIVLECRYMSSTELENIYVIGDFGVSSYRAIIKEPEQLAVGDWGLQGYYFYHSGIKYKYNFEYNEEMGRDLILDIGKYSDVVTIVRINGMEQIIPWKSKSKTDIGDVLVPGDNLIEIEVMGSPRNMFGPLHLEDSREKWTGAGAFHPSDDMYTKQYITHPWGLMEQVCIYSR